MDSYTKDQRKFPRVNCAGEVTLRSSHGPVAGNLCSLSQSGFAFISSTKIEPKSTFEGSIKITRNDEIIYFRACTVWVLKERHSKSGDKYKVAFMFMSTSPGTKQIVRSLVESKQGRNKRPFVEEDDSVY